MYFPSLSARVVCYKGMLTPDQLQSFYADLFRWEIHADNPMNYGIVHTNSGDKGIGGGITEGDARVNVVVDVDDLQKYLELAPTGSQAADAKELLNSVK